MYATENDIIKIYSEAALQDVLSDAALDDATIRAANVETALETASLKIDGYLSAKYTLPLADKPAVLRQPTVDIALYTLASSQERLTDELTKRHDDAITFLEKISAGKAGLGESEPRIATDEGSSADGAFFSARPRQFGRGR